MKTTRSWICVYSKEKQLQSSNQEKIDENSLLVLFFSTKPIVLANNLQLKKKKKI